MWPFGVVEREESRRGSQGPTGRPARGVASGHRGGDRHSAAGRSDGWAAAVPEELGRRLPTARPGGSEEDPDGRSVCPRAKRQVACPTRCPFFFLLCPYFLPQARWLAVLFRRTRAPERLLSRELGRGGGESSVVRSSAAFSSGLCSCGVCSFLLAGSLASSLVSARGFLSS